MTLKQYATQEGITLGAAYLRVWNGKVPGAKQIYGRWIINPENTGEAGMLAPIAPVESSAVVPA